MKKTNILATILSLYLPLIYIGITIATLLEYGNSIFGIIMIIVDVFITIICYFGSMIQGIRAVGNGKAGTYKSAAQFQLFLILPHIVSAIAIKVTYRNSSDIFMKKATTVFLVIFVVMLIMAIARINMLMGHSKNEKFVEGSPKTAFKIILICIVAPILLCVIVVLGIKIIQIYPIIGKIMIGIAVLIIFGGPVALVITIFFGSIQGGSSGGAKEEHRVPIKANDDKSAIIKDLNERYEREYKNITGSSPSSLDWKIIKNGPKLNAVKALRKNMTIEAKAKGVKGKTKYF